MKSSERLGSDRLISLARLCIFSFLLALQAPIAKGAEASATAQPYTFAFRDAELAQVAEAVLGSGLGLSYRVDPSIRAKLSFRIDQRLTRPQLLSAFETALSAQDLVFVKEGEVLAILPRAKAKGVTKIGGEAEGLHAIGYQTVTARLNYAAPSEVAKALEGVALGETVVFVDDKQSVLVLGGSGRELDAALKAIKLFDKNGFEDAKIRWFSLEKTPVTSVAGELELILRAGGMSGVSIVPLKRLNGLFAFARTSAALDEVAKWVAKLDVASENQNSSLWIYRPKNASAESMKATLIGALSTLGEGSNSTAPAKDRPTETKARALTGASQPLANSQQKEDGSITVAGLGVGDQVRIGVDPDSNALLISTTPAQWVQIQHVLNELDRAPNQILIEASILEVTLTNSYKFGVDWKALTDNGRVAVSQSNNSAGSIGASNPGLSVTFLDSSISAAISTLGAKTEVEVMSAPKIMALDNKTAHLDVGDQVPIVVQNSQSTSSAGAPIVSSIDYRSTGVILQVTPRIVGEERISMDVDQEVSSVAPPASSAVNSPTIQQRKFKSTLIMKDGGTVALGGLISNNRSSGSSGVPYLHSVPLLGQAFGSTSKSKDRTELIVLISAKIIRDGASATNTYADLMSDMKELEARGLVRPPPRSR